MKKYVIGSAVLLCYFIVGEIAASLSSFSRGNTKTGISEKPTIINPDGNLSPNQSVNSSKLSPVSEDSDVRDEIPTFDAVTQNAHKKLYTNYEYAYKVKIPSGLVALSPRPPLPQHGIGIIMSESPKSYLWTDGSYNAPMYESLDAAVDQEIEWLKEQSETGVDVIRRENTYLDKFPAVRLTMKYTSRATKEKRVQDSVIALRKDEVSETEIIYTIGLAASEIRYMKNVAVFETLVKGWRKTDRPK